MLARATLVHSWTERGDLKNAREEEGRQEGKEEEVARRPEKREGGPIALPCFRELTATDRRQMTPER